MKVKYNQVQGVFVGSVVSLSGMTVGNVDKIGFDGAEQAVIVTMSIDSDYRKRLTKGSLASIQTQGALGDKYIYIEPGPFGGEVLAENSFIEPKPEADLIELIKSRGPDFTHIMDTFKQLNILLTGINETGSLRKTLQNMSVSTEELKSVIRESKKTVATMSSVMSKIDSGQGTLGAVINDPTLHNKLLQFVGDSPRNKYLKPLLRESIK